MHTWIKKEVPPEKMKENAPGVDDERSFRIDGGQKTVQNRWFEKI